MVCKYFLPLIISLFILLIGHCAEQTFSFLWGPIYRFFLLWVTFLVSSLRTLCLALDPEHFLPFFGLWQSNCSSTICWKGYLSSVELFLPLCKKSVGPICVDSLFTISLIANIYSCFNLSYFVLFALPVLFSFISFLPSFGLVEYFFSIFLYS